MNPPEFHRDFTADSPAVSPEPARCSAVNRHGERCRSLRGLVEIDGVWKCATHAGLTSKKQEDVSDLVDDKLRTKARRRLDAMLDDPNPNIRIRAATAIGSYSPEKPVSESERKGWNVEYAGVPIAELAKVLKAALGDQPIEILPSPGEVMNRKDTDTE